MFGVIGFAGAVVEGVVGSILGSVEVTHLDPLAFTVAVVSAPALVGVLEGLTGNDAS